MTTLGVGQGPAADVGGGGGAGAGGDGGGGRRRRRRDLVAVRSPRSSSRSRCRSASTTRTTTPTACAAPTAIARGRCASPPPEPRRRRRCATRPRSRSRVGGGRRSRAVARRQPVAVARRRRRDRGRGALHRRTGAARLPRPRRAHGARLLRVRRDGRLRVRAGEVRARAPRGGARSSSGCSPAPSSSPTTCATSPPTPRRGKRTLAVRVGASTHVRCSSRVTWARSLAIVAIGVTQPWALLGLLALPLALKPIRIMRHSADPPSLVARARRDVEARGRRGRPRERGAVPVLTEHVLRIGDRSVTLIEGPAGWGECSPLAGLSVRSRGLPACRRGGGAARLPACACATTCR